MSSHQPSNAKGLGHLPDSFVETLRECYSRGFGLVPNTKEYWHPRWCSFRLVPLQREAEMVITPRMRVSLYSPSHARKVLEGFPVIANDEDSFESFVSRHYGHVEASAQSGGKVAQERAFCGDFATLAVA